jgi:hypothetical protein
MISPQVLLETLQQSQEPAVELVPPQEATTGRRLPVKDFALLGGGVLASMMGFSVLRNRREARVAVDEPAAS